AHHSLTDVLNPGVSNSALAPAQVAWFNQARAADPNATLYVNDYSILASGGLTNTSHQQYLYDQVAYLKAQGAPVGGIGFQSHFGSANARTTGDKLVQILDRYAQLGVDLAVTEFDMYGDGWTEASKAAYMRDFMTAVFAEKAVTGFTMWGFWDGQHFAGSAPLFDADWNLKESGQAFMDLVFDQWWTDVSGTTDASGLYATRGFLGDYAIDVTLAGKTTSYATTLDASGRALTIVVPEPATIGAIAGATLILLRRRRRCA
ncbi:PEP-CTERM sorting domain-containing protein, partial [bacterium]